MHEHAPLLPAHRRHDNRMQGSSVPSKGFTTTIHCDDNEVSFLISRFLEEPWSMVRASQRGERDSPKTSRETNNNKKNRELFFSRDVCLGLTRRFLRSHKLSRRDPKNVS